MCHGEPLNSVAEFDVDVHLILPGEEIMKGHDLSSDSERGTR